MSRDMRFAHALRAQLAQRNMSARKLAGLAEINETMIYNYASGRAHPSIETLRVIRETLGCSWEELLGE